MTSFNAIGHYPSLNAAERYTLLARVEAGRKWIKSGQGATDEEKDLEGSVVLTDDARIARDLLVRGNTKLVALLITKNRLWRLINHDADREDLMQEALDGMTRAIERFQASLGFSLGTYAQQWINSRADSWGLKMGYIKDPVAKQSGKMPLNLLSSLDSPTPEGDYESAGRSQYESIASTQPSQLRLIERDENMTALRDLMDTIALGGPTRLAEMQAVRYSLGFDTNVPQTLDWIAQTLGISSERARQIRLTGFVRILSAWNGIDMTLEETRAFLIDVGFLNNSSPQKKKNRLVA